MSYGDQLKKSQPALKSFVNSKIYNEADVADIVQNVNEVALNKAASYEEGRCFEAWIIGIAKYQILNYFKKNKALPPLLSLDLYGDERRLVDENKELFLGDIPFADLVVDERVALQHQIKSILTNTQKKIFKRLCSGQSVQEIAMELNTNPNRISTEKSRLIQRAKAYIKKLNLINRYDYRSNR